jgi:hypothetical protein
VHRLVNKYIINFNSLGSRFFYFIKDTRHYTVCIRLIFCTKWLNMTINNIRNMPQLLKIQASPAECITCCVYNNTAVSSGNKLRQ